MDSHQEIAMRLLEKAGEPSTHRDYAPLLVAQAQVHATLALVSAVYDTAPVTR